MKVKKGKTFEAGMIRDQGVKALWEKRASKKNRPAKSEFSFLTGFLFYFPGKQDIMSSNLSQVLFKLTLPVKLRLKPSYGRSRPKISLRDPGLVLPFFPDRRGRA